MNPERDRRLLEATAEGVHALLREYTERFAPPRHGVLSGAQKAQKKLRGVLNPQPDSSRPDRQFSMGSHELVGELKAEIDKLQKENAELKKQLRAVQSTKEAILHSIDRDRLLGATVDELEIRLGLPHQTVSARVHELAKAGLIVRNGTRKTRSGKQAAIWWRK